MTKHVHLVVCLGVLLLVSNAGSAQGTFGNLDFEHPILPLTPDPINQVATFDALPGWTAYIGGIQVDRVAYNTVALGSAAISFHGPGSLEPVLQGRYSVILQSSFPGFRITAAVAQVGTVPETARSLQFYGASEISPNGPVFFNVSVAGQQLPVSVVGGSSDSHYVYAADLSGFAGKTVELRLWGYGMVDDIQFSPNAVPEPNFCALLLLGLPFLLWRGRRTR
jgi:hypothetical protein